MPFGNRNQFNMPIDVSQTAINELANRPRQDINGQRYGNTLSDDMFSVKNPSLPNRHTPESIEYFNQPTVEAAPQTWEPAAGWNPLAAVSGPLPVLERNGLVSRKKNITGESLPLNVYQGAWSLTNDILEFPDNYAPVIISKVHFSAIAPRTLTKGEYAIIDIVMYQDVFRSVIDEIIKKEETPPQETRSGTVMVREGVKVKIQLTSPDIVIEDNVEEQEWVGDYLIYNFAVMLPKEYAKRQVLFMATVYIDDVIATRLKFVVKCWSLLQQKIKVKQEDVLSAFVSYASQDRNRVALIVQGMQKARPDMDIFFDVESLRSGESWEEALWTEINQRDTLFLCWSRNAAESPWVAREWKYCYKQKGAEAIEPIPLEPPSLCPPPEELKTKHFNDRLLYLIKAESERNIP